MHPVLIALLALVPVGVVTVAVVAGKGDGAPDNGNGGDLPGNVVMLRTMADAQKHAQTMSAFDTGSINGIGFGYRTENAALLSALASVARAHPNLTFMGIAESLADKIGGEAAGVDFRCPAGAGGAAGAARGGAEVGFECWEIGASAAKIRAILEGLVAAI